MSKINGFGTGPNIVFDMDIISNTVSGYYSTGEYQHTMSLVGTIA
jgi:hypothetical protein